MNPQEKTTLALSLIERAEGMLTRRAAELRHSTWHTEGLDVEESRHLAVLRLLEIVSTHVVDEHGPDEDWYRDYFTVTGQHVILTDEGWEPADMKASHLEFDPKWEPLDELNAPTRSAIRDSGGDGGR